MEFEKTILFNLSTNSNYTQLVSGHLDKKFFDNFYNKELFEYINNYIEKYKDLPTKSVLQHEISKSNKYTEKQFEEIISQLDSVFEAKENSNVEWLVDETEKYCQLVSAENGIIECMELIKKDVKNKQDILGIMKEALNVEFNGNIGIDFFDPESIAKRFDDYNKPSILHKTGIGTLDATIGGLKSKVMTVIMAPSGIGKTLAKISMGAGALKQGANIAYFTCEMGENEISQRFEANMLDVEINQVKHIDKNIFKSNLQKLKEGSYGQLMIKEFPPASATCNDIERILDEWKIKSGFIADVVIVDYLNILLSYRIKDSNSYQTVKAICEEFRGLCVRRDVAGLTSTQTNREGMAVSKLSYNNISDSVGTVMTADVLIGIISNEETRSAGYQIFQILKNRNTGIIDYFFPMKVIAEFSKIVDGCEEEYNSSLFLNNNPETILRVEKILKYECDSMNRKMDKNKSKIRKKVVDEEKSMVKIHPKGSDFIFDEEGNDIM